MKPDVTHAGDFIERLAGSRGAPMTFQTFDDGRARKRSGLAHVFHGPLHEYAQELCSLQEQGAGVFVMVNEGDGEMHAGQRTCRTAANVRRVRALFVDLDGAPIEPVLACAIPPDIVVASSPGRYHAYWTGVECPLEDFTTAQWSLASRFGGDDVCDLPRVMRLPGFYHQKGEPHLTRICS